jgi:hypothetical protein
MKSVKVIVLLLITACASIVRAQDFSSHLWNDRLIIIKTNPLNINKALYNSQIEEFKNNKVGLESRRILIYQISNDQLKYGIENSSDWIKFDAKNKMPVFIENSEVNFEILLIGLDGKIKLRQFDLLKCKDLFSIIDVMPMRIQELKNN